MVKLYLGEWNITGFQARGISLANEGNSPWCPCLSMTGAIRATPGRRRTFQRQSESKCTSWSQREWARGGGGGGDSECPVPYGRTAIAWGSDNNMKEKKQFLKTHGWHLVSTRASWLRCYLWPQQQELVPKQGVAPWIGRAESQGFGVAVWGHFSVMMFSLDITSRLLFSAWQLQKMSPIRVTESNSSQDNQVTWDMPWDSLTTSELWRKERHWSSFQNGWARNHVETLLFYSQANMT